jgi:hypothetical protein
MIALDRVLCDCCGDDMGQIVVPGAISDQRKAPHFAVCPDCLGDACDFLGLPLPEVA